MQNSPPSFFLHLSQTAAQAPNDKCPDGRIGQHPCWTLTPGRLLPLGGMVTITILLPFTKCAPWSPAELGTFCALEERCILQRQAPTLRRYGVVLDTFYKYNSSCKVTSS